MKALGILLRLFILICPILLVSACGMALWSPEETDKTNVLSNAQVAKQQTLLAGRSSRPPLSSLNLLPARTSENIYSSNLQNDKANKKHQVPQLSLTEKRDEYMALLALVVDPEQRRQIRFRLADIQMLLAEVQLEQGNEAPNQSYFGEAIAAYLQVLNNNEVVTPMPGSSLTEEEQALNIKMMDAMYQLSRALDLAGEREQSVDVAKEFIASFNPNSFAITNKHVELWFRIGEHYFTQQKFAQAIHYYRQVLAYPNYGDFYGISAYMLGWSYFKLDEYNDALIAFDKLLEHSMSNQAALASKTLDDIQLSKGIKRLVEDSLRVMAITFSYQGNGKAITQFYREHGEQLYQHLVYEELAQQYLDDDRYIDSAEVLLGFARNWPSHPRAVSFYIRHIDAFILGDFPDRVFMAKQGFVSLYGLGKGVVDTVQSPIGSQALPYLKQYLPELAQTEHSVAQQLERYLKVEQTLDTSDDHAAYQTAFVDGGKKEGKSNADVWRKMPVAALKQEKNAAYESAVYYYDNFIQTFTDVEDMSAKIAELRFYMAEALFALGLYPEAITAFETYAYKDKVNPMAVEAAYAGILAWRAQEIQSTVSKKQAIDSRSQPENITDNAMALSTPIVQYTPSQQAQKRFVETFEGDPRSVEIGISLMQTLFVSKHHIEAIKWAAWVLVDAREQHRFSNAQLDSAYLVTAHSYYALNNFAQAEVYYAQIINRLNDSDERVVELRDALAASIFKQAEVALNNVNLDKQAITRLDLASADLSESSHIGLNEALTHLQRLMDKTPNVDIRTLAQFDSATYYALLGNWQRAIELWQDFKQRFPQHELTPAIEPQLLFAFEQTEDWQPAAEMLLAQYFNDKTSAQASVQLFTAAEYFDKATNREMALDSYRRFAHAFPTPIANANEARYKLSEFYLQSNEDSKRRYWLNKMMQAQLQLAKASTNNDPSTAGTPRSRYLAGMSAMVFAEDAFQVYKRVKLTAPLDKSLAKKQHALSKTIDAYDRVMSFAVAEYTTAANYRVARVYDMLAQDLMDSERPDNLSALEASQYDILLEEQAFPFEETAIQMHENNINRVKSGLYDEHIKKSFVALSKALPVKYNKPVLLEEVNADEL